MIQKYFSVVALVFLMGAVGMAGEAVRERTLFTDDWRFQKNDAAGIGDNLSYFKNAAVKEAVIASASGTGLTESQRDIGKEVPYTSATFDDAKWRKLDLPHDWGIEGPFDPKGNGETAKLPWAGVGWYRKTFDLPKTDAGRRIYLDIDGAMAYSMVWCNGKFVGGWPYGYASFRLDLTSYIKAGEMNTLAIRLDNPPDSSRWYPGSGLYRNVWLVKTSPVHVAHWGTVITTPEVRAESATVQIKAEVRNTLDKNARVEMNAEIFALDDKFQKGKKPEVIAEAQGVDVAAGKIGEIISSTSVPSPRLWSTKTPSLYAAVITLKHDGKVVDVYESRFGIRTIEFKADSGFWLNGENVRIKGVCLHHDLGSLGTAWNYRAAQRQLEIMKEMGINGLRTSHNPPAPELLDLCDQMGLVVIDEAFDCWKVPKRPNDYSRIWNDWHKNDLRALVKRDINHPSVIMWSLGNEVYDLHVLPDEKTSPILTGELTQIVKECDPTRPTTLGSHHPPASYNGVQNNVGVFGQNYQNGGYERFRQENPSVPLIGSETCSTVSTRGAYVFETKEQVDAQNAEAAKNAQEKGQPVPTPKVFLPVSEGRHDGRDWKNKQMSSYDMYVMHPFPSYTPDSEFKSQEMNPHVAGEFVWTGFDYLGESYPFVDVSRSSYFGIVDLAGFKKDRFYIYQAHWKPELPMAHILPHWTWPERVGQVTPVHVYTSGDEAELFLNGKSQGRLKKNQHEYRLRWENVVYEPGELKVVAYKEGKPWASEVMRTAGAAEKLAMDADRLTIRNDGLDLTFVTVQIQDKQGTLVPRSSNLIKFEATGAGEIVAVDNGDATSLDSFQAKECKAFNGMALVIVRAKKGAQGDCVLKATSESLKDASVTIRIEGK
jgi:beta-galactosidase